MAATPSPATPGGSSFTTGGGTGGAGGGVYATSGPPPDGGPMAVPYLQILLPVTVPSMAVAT